MNSLAWGLGGGAPMLQPGQQRLQLTAVHPPRAAGLRRGADASRGYPPPRGPREGSRMRHLPTIPRAPNGSWRRISRPLGRNKWVDKPRKFKVRTRVSLNLHQKKNI